MTPLQDARSRLATIDATIKDIDAKKAAYLASDAKVDVADLAAVVGEGAWISRVIREASMSDNYKRDRLVDYERPNAVTHLEHVKSKSKEPCECGKCRGDRQSAEWAKKNVKVAA